uniref:Uncharacterized protein n=1 Tax=Tanacetum cinerariifolium TaxID=118510 RepID=A0A6L2P776_TANCI|nr:hypothetical protein [Tanacetum cinerariifolium]
MIIKMKKNEKNFQTNIKNIERKIDEWSKSQNLSSEDTDRTEPPPPSYAHTELNKTCGAWIGGWHFTLGDLYNWNIILHVSNGIGINLYEWADNLVAAELVLDHHLLDSGEVHLKTSRATSAATWHPLTGGQPSLTGCPTVVEQCGGFGDSWQATWHQSQGDKWHSNHEVRGTVVADNSYILEGAKRYGAFAIWVASGTSSIQNSIGQRGGASGFLPTIHHGLRVRHRLVKEYELSSRDKRSLP